MGKKTVRKPEPRENASNTKKYNRLQQFPGKKVYIMLFIGHAITIINIPKTPNSTPHAMPKNHPKKSATAHPKYVGFRHSGLLSWFCLLICKRQQKAIPVYLLTGVHRLGVVVLALDKQTLQQGQGG